MNRPYSESCEQNKFVILDVIRAYLNPGIEVLEIGSGTGQHAIFFAEQNPSIYWQTSDRPEYIDGINNWLDFAGLKNLAQPLVLDVCKLWPDQTYDLVFTANSLHIMGKPEAEQCIINSARVLRPGGYLIVYGPFNYDGHFTSESNRNFEQWLKQQNPESGIKDFEWADEIATIADLKLIDDIAMPANNRILIWQHETLDI
jgi:SAM-dependent methyltransferase